MLLQALNYGKLALNQPVLRLTRIDHEGAHRDPLFHHAATLQLVAPLDSTHVIP